MGYALEARRTTVRAVPIRDPSLRRDIGLVYLAGRSLSPAAELLTKALRSVTARKRGKDRYQCVSEPSGRR